MCTLLQKEHVRATLNGDALLLLSGSRHISVCSVMACVLYTRYLHIQPRPCIFENEI